MGLVAESLCVVLGSCVSRDATVLTAEVPQCSSKRQTQCIGVLGAQGRSLGLVSCEYTFRCSNRFWGGGDIMPCRLCHMLGNCWTPAHRSPLLASAPRCGANVSKELRIRGSMRAASQTILCICQQLLSWARPWFAAEA